MTDTRFSVLVVGGAGVFGSRLCDLLSRHVGMFRIVVGGRTVSRAQGVREAIRRHDPGADGGFVPFDRVLPNVRRLRSLGVKAVVDAAGPFQGASYALPKACIEAGIHYVDIADGREFVAGIVNLDAEAKAAGVAVLSGASSTPALTVAAVESLTAGWTEISRIETFITPGNRAPRGLSVVEAILAEAGGSTAVFDDGRWGQATPFRRWVSRDIPGLGRRSASLCPTPDLDVMVERFRPTSGAVFRAGLELGLLNAGLGLLARLRSLGLIRDLIPLARPLRWAADLLRGLGTDRGAMHVEVTGTDADRRPVKAEWTLVADGNDGPTIPTLAAASLLSGLAQGRVAFAGAAPAIGLMSLEDILREGEGLSLEASRSVTGMEPPPFVQALGSHMDILPAVTRRLHGSDRSLVLEGEATVKPAANAIGGLVSRIFGFPTVSGTVPCRVLLERVPGEERWVRFFGSQRMVSDMSHAGPSMVDETFAMVTTRLRIYADRDGLSLVPVSARAWGVHVPRFLHPQVTAREWEAGEGIHAFLIEIGLPLVGRLVRYEGWLRIS